MGLDEGVGAVIRAVVGGDAWDLKSPLAQCEDAEDNDSDGWTDLDDPDCANANTMIKPRWNNEASPTEPNLRVGRPVVGLSHDPGMHPVVFSAEFDSDGDPRTARDIAQTVSHELAHAFGAIIGHGLSHYGSNHFNTAGDVTQILGTRYAKRSIWYRHADVILGQDLVTGAFVYGPQDDLASLLVALGEKPDDHADHGWSATRIAFDHVAGGETWLGDDGVISMNADTFPSCAPEACAPGGNRMVYWADDRDYFAFQAGPGPFTVRVDTVNEITGTPHAANLDVEIELRRWVSDGSGDFLSPAVDPNSIARGHGPDDLFAQVRHDPVNRGTFLAIVKSHGDYGDVGRYHIDVFGNDVSEYDGVAGTSAGGDEPTLADPEPGVTLVPSIEPVKLAPSISLPTAELVPSISAATPSLAPNFAAPRPRVAPRQVFSFGK
jgi:hypothetical protein